MSERNCIPYLCFPPEGWGAQGDRITCTGCETSWFYSEGRWQVELHEGLSN